MEALSSSMFPLLRKVKGAGSMCSIHPNEELVQLGEHDPFCKLCATERLAVKDRNLVEQGMAKIQRRRFYEVLRKDSIFDDPEVPDCNFDNYETTQNSEAQVNRTKARHLAGKYLDTAYTPNTVFTGVPGTGKTHLAMAMLNAVNEHAEGQTSCLFVSVNELVRRVKGSFRDSSSKYKEDRVLRMMGEAGLLVLDDLGSEASFKAATTEASDWVQQLLFGILNRRAGKGRIIITTNLTSEQLSRIYNTKLVSRMFKGVKAADAVIKFTEATTDKRLEMI